MGRKRNAKEVHKQSLGDQIDNPETYGVRVYPHKKARSKKADDEDETVRPEQSSAILSLAREQQQEVEREVAAEAMGGGDAGMLAAAVGKISRGAASDDDDEGEWDVGEEEFDDAEDFYVDDMDNFTAEDEAVFNLFMQRDKRAGEKSTLLSDLITSKLQEHKERRAAPEEDAAGASTSGVDEQLEQVYTDVGTLLKRYTTGKLPKAFKIIPHLRNWEEVVFITDPQNWSPHATYAATKMFVSQLNAKQTQRFLNLILLNKVRDDIRSHRRLHFALFQAVKKAVFKPGAFYKGLVLPLLQTGDCTLREAVIFSSILGRVSIPVDHSAAALLRMADMPYSGVTSFFIKTLLDKKYALPYRVIDAMVDHYTSFKKEERVLPVIWHLCLLTFVQRYKHQIRAEDKEAIRSLLKVQCHHAVTPEIHRELNHGRDRGDKAAAPGALDVQMKTNATEDVFNMAPVNIADMEF